MASSERRLFRFRIVHEKAQEVIIIVPSKVRNGTRRAKVSCTQDMLFLVKGDVVLTIDDDVALPIAATMLVVRIL